MIDYATISMIGSKEKNEDAVRAYINQPLAAYGFLVADGLGGHGNGEIASNFVADCIGAAIENTSSIEGSFIDECFDTSQKMLMEEKEINGMSSIKTTLVLLLISNGIAQWGHIGDSRLYLFHDAKMVSRTVDHSVPQLLALRKEIKEKEIRHHPQRSMLLKAMGSEWYQPEYEIDQRRRKIRNGDAFLLCSDGFWEWIEEKEMQRVIRKKQSAYDTLREMTDIVCKNGTGKDMDNLSVVYIRIS